VGRDVFDSSSLYRIRIEGHVQDPLGQRREDDHRHCRSRNANRIVSAGPWLREIQIHGQVTQDQTGVISLGSGVDIDICEPPSGLTFEHFEIGSRVAGNQTITWV